MLPWNILFIILFNWNNFKYINQYTYYNSRLPIGNDCHISFKQNTYVISDGISLIRERIELAAEGMWCMPCITSSWSCSAMLSLSKSLISTNCLDMMRPTRCAGIGSNADDNTNGCTWGTSGRLVLTCRKTPSSNWFVVLQVVSGHFQCTPSLTSFLTLSTIGAPLLWDWVTPSQNDSQSLARRQWLVVTAS